jgi:RimJ/RimL family protein N-acetyltransferase
MIEVREFRPEDVDGIEPQDVHARALDALDDWRKMICTAAACGPAWTAMHNGKIIGVAGLGQHWPGRAEAWCLLAREVPMQAWPAIHRAVLRVLAGAGYLRVDATARQGFAQAQRWLAMLGFVPEGVMHAYGPDGSDHMRWARVRR